MCESEAHRRRVSFPPQYSQGERAELTPVVAVLLTLVVVVVMVVVVMVTGVIIVVVIVIVVGSNSILAFFVGGVQYHFIFVETRSSGSSR